MASSGSLAQLDGLLTQWLDINSGGLESSPVKVLNEISAILEDESYTLDPYKERETYPDILEDPPDTHLKSLLKRFGYKVVQACRRYIINQEDFELNCAGARLLFSLRPAFCPNNIFIDEDCVIPIVMKWVNDGAEPLRSYSCGLLVNAMRYHLCSDDGTKDEIVTMLIKRLHHLSKISDLAQPCIEEFDKNPTPFAGSNRLSSESNIAEGPNIPKRKQKQPSKNSTSFQYGKPITSLKPLTIGKQQDLILRCLIPIETTRIPNQEIELGVLDLIFHYIDPTQQKDSQIACSALKYLEYLLHSRQIIKVEFFKRDGIERLLEIPQPSSVATMATACLLAMVQKDKNYSEMISMLPRKTLLRIMKFLSQSLQSSHDSAKDHAVQFFEHTLKFKAIFHCFQSIGCLELIINRIVTLKDLFYKKDTNHFHCHTMLKYTLETLKLFIDVNIVIIANKCNGKNDEVPEYKPLIISEKLLEESFETIIKNTGEGFIAVKAKIFIESMMSLKIPQVLLKLILTISESRNTDTQYESEKEFRLALFNSTMEILLALSSFKELALSICCQNISPSQDGNSSGMRYLLRAAKGEMQDAGTVFFIKTRKTALKVLCSCLSDKAFLTRNSSRTKSCSLHSKSSVMRQIFSSLRMNNGLMVLVNIVELKQPDEESYRCFDILRAYACKALYILTQDESICKLMNKMPFKQKWLLLLPKPLINYNVEENDMFVKYCSVVLRRVYGQPSKDIISHGESKEICLTSEPKIHYPQKEVLHIFYQHLKQQGLEKTAETLKIEARLPIELDSSAAVTSATQQNYQEQSKTPVAKQVAIESYQRVRSDTSPPPNKRRVLCTLKRRKSQKETSSNHSSYQQQHLVEKNLIKEEHRQQNVHNPITVDDLVKSYFLSEQNKCSKCNKESNLSFASLLKPHSCVKDRPQYQPSKNVTNRVFRHQQCSPLDEKTYKKHARQFVFSRFRPGKSFKSRNNSDEDFLSDNSDSSDEEYRSCEWLGGTGSLIFGTNLGNLKIVNKHGELEYNNCFHEDSVLSIETSTDCNLIASSACVGRPKGVVSRIINNPVGNEILLQLGLELEDDMFLKFDNGKTRVIGINDYTANMYDLGTGQRIASFYDKDNVNSYAYNTAQFSPCDNLVLNDGVLWDVRSHQLVHKYDKFGEECGNFHRNGREVIIGAEIVSFPNNGQAIYELHQFQNKFTPLISRVYSKSFT